MFKPFRCLLLVSCVLWPLGAGAQEVPVFTEEAEAAGLRHIYGGEFEHFVGGGVAGLDCNGDRLPDLVLAGGAYPAQLYVNRSSRGGALRFEAAALTAADQTGVSGVYPLDLDNDRNIDLVLLRVGENRILRGLGDCRFEDATVQFGFDGGAEWSTGFSAVWEAGATYPTLAIGNYIDQSAEGAPFGTCHDNQIVRATDGPRFDQRFTLSPGYCSLSIHFTDWNQTGQSALRIANDRQYYRGDGQEQMWQLPPGGPPLALGLGDGWRKLNIWGMGIAEADLTGDGRPEYAITSMGDTKLQALDMAEPGLPGYTDIAAARGTTAHRPYTGGDVKPSTGWHTEFADFNNDGLPDLYIAKGNVERMDMAAGFDPDNLLLGQPDGQFVEVGAAAGIALARRGRGAVVEDFNLDGLLDFVVVNREEPVSLFRNTAAVLTGNGYLRLYLDAGDGPNPFAVGAVVEVQAGDRLMRQALQIGGGHGSDHLGALHFGLGGAEAARVQVTWPDGTVTDYPRLTGSEAYVLTRTGSRPLGEDG